MPVLYNKTLLILESLFNDSGSVLSIFMLLKSISSASSLACTPNTSRIPGILNVISENSFFSESLSSN